MYNDLKTNALDIITGELGGSYEIIFVNDGSTDKSWEIIEHIKSLDANVKGFSLSRNFGSHQAQTCGIFKATGDCIAVKAADLQEPSYLIVDMYKQWLAGNKVVLAVRQARSDGKMKDGFSNVFYWLTQKVALKNMPKGGFDIYLIDRIVANTISHMDEINSPLPMQILWSGFTTSLVPYTRLEREVGESKWTLKKKIKYVTDMLFSFSTVPITVVSAIGIVSAIIGIIWTISLVIARVSGVITSVGWTSLFAFQLVTFGVIMFSISIIGAYLWRTFEASKNRPLFIVEKEMD